MFLSLDWIQMLIISFLLFLPIVYELSNTFKYYAKFALYYTIVMLTSVVVISYGVFRPKNVKNMKFISWLMKNVKMLFGITIEVRSKENLEIDSPYILVSNHQSSLDFFGMMEIWPENCSSLAKKELLYVGPFGLAAWLCGTVFIDRLNHEKALDTIKSTAALIKEQNVPIIPVVFSSYSEFYSKREKKFGTGKFIISCLPKIKTEGLTAAQVPDLTDFIRKQMLDVYNQTSLETTQAKLSNGTK
ncbi:hypothetical protein KUTeg_021734 [Tegillarca granosa]|uniref:1-acylglycerol-3-phosphate O-acyltransferase n=1 Tax=Tegillarca granosa TaxID=220873 RepID=A0ABQ9E527_TEGGR|nr:hypothetical protein KUTeg_021734 [Tegillarca granosa]